MVDLVELVKKFIDTHATCWGVPDCCGPDCPMMQENRCQVDNALGLMRLGEQAKESSDEVLGAIKETFPDATVGIMRNVTWAENKEDPNASD